MSGRILTPAEVEALAALKTTPGSWWPSLHNGPNDVDRGKIWGFRAGPAPVQMVVVAEVNRFIGTAEDQRLIASAPDLRRTALHLLQQRDEARARVTELEAPGECQSLHKLRAEVERLKAELAKPVLLPWQKHESREIWVRRDGELSGLPLMVSERGWSACCWTGRPRRWCGVASAEGIELGRLVLLDSEPCNAESWFVARAFRLLRAELPEVRTVLSYSDPVPREGLAGQVVMPGHVGVVYQALNARYVGRSASSRPRRGLRRVLWRAAVGRRARKRWLARGVTRGVCDRVRRGHDVVDLVVHNCP